MTEIAVAQFVAEGAGGKIGPLAVDFNPSSLRLAITNTIQGDQQPGSKDVQAISKSATKLDVELVFDSTETGADVRNATNVLKSMGRPGGTQKSVLPRVTFSWGVFSFKGLIESLQETIDFFSSAGVPLRSTVQLAMQSLELDQTLAGGGDDGDDDVSLAPPASPGQGATDTATRAGNPDAGRALATANGLASMRFTAGAGLAVSGSVQLSGPIGFSSGGGAGFGASAAAGAGIGLSAGADFSASAGAGVSGGASASAGFGASASAGVSATAGAFAGLGVSKSVGTGFTLNVERLRQTVPTQSVSVDATGSFDATGRVVATASPGLRADVRGTAQASAGATASAWIG